MVDILTDSQFAKPAIQKAFYQAKHNHPAYFYTFYQLPGKKKCFNQAENFLTKCEFC